MEKFNTTYNKPDAISDVRIDFVTKQIDRIE